MSQRGPTAAVLLQKKLLQQLLKDSNAYGTLLGSGGVGDPGMFCVILHGHNRLGVWHVSVIAKCLPLMRI